MDGKEEKKQTFLDSLIAVSRTEGTHEIELRYMTPGLRLGAAISGGALLIFLLIIARRCGNSSLLDCEDY